MAQLDAIYNFIQIDATLGTAGQPKPDEFEAIGAAGYEMVINLAAGQSEEFNPDEGEIVQQLGIDYIHIPVDWTNPTADDYARFVQSMKANAGKKCFVHCIANYRVTAFTFLYRVIEQGVPVDEARAVMNRIWEPGDEYPIWDAFIKAQLKARGF